MPAEQSNAYIVRVEIHLPPLRKRPEDIPILAEFFLQRLSRKYGMARIRLSGEGVEALQKHHWPGNVRELENTMARACALATTDLLLPDDIPLARSPFSGRRKLQAVLDNLLDLRPVEGDDVIDWAANALANHVLQKTKGDLKETARRLGSSVTALRKILDSRPSADDSPD